MMPSLVVSLLMDEVTRATITINLPLVYNCSRNCSRARARSCRRLGRLCRSSPAWQTASLGTDVTVTVEARMRCIVKADLDLIKALEKHGSATRSNGTLAKK